MIPLLLSVIAIMSYLLGNINAVRIASRIIFRRELPAFTGDRALLEVNRVFGVPGLIAVNVVDAAKTLIAVLLGGLILHIAGGEPADSPISYTVVGQLFAAFCLLLGHCFPVFGRFRGGKGGLCALVAMLCIHFPLGLLVALIAAGVTAIWRFIALGTLAGAFVAPFLIWMEYGGLCGLLALFCVLVVYVRHVRSIRNLLRRREPKLNFQKDLSMKFEEEDF